MMNFHEIFLGEEKFFNRKVAIFHAAIFFAAVAFLYLFSYSTSPLYKSFGDDSAIFQAVGKGWTQGLLPYVDMFENKGPLIFAIDAFGYLIYPRVGIFLLQIPFMYFSMLFACRAVGLYISGKTKFAAIIFTLIYYIGYYLDGNRTEEWSMPWLMASTYFFLRWLRDEKNFLPPSIGFFYGFGFGACVLLRAMNALPLCCYVLLTTFLLIRAGAFKNIWKNFLSFWSGFAIICLPFVIYFAAHGALYDMLYGTILINMTYTVESSGYPLNLIFAFYVTMNFLPLILLTLFGFLRLFKEKSKLMMSAFFVGGFMLIFMIKARPYLGYCALIVPTIPLLFIVADKMIRKLPGSLRKIWKVKSFSPKILATKLCVYCPLFIIGFACWLYASLFYMSLEILYAEKSYSEVARDKMICLAEFIPPQERNSVVTWGRSGFIADWILNTDIKSREKFFGYIKSFGEVDPSVRKNFFEHVRENRPKWVLYCWKKQELYSDMKDSIEMVFLSNKDTELEKFLTENYTLETMENISGQIVKLYRLRE